jgi:5,10-methylenetetrahydromethanopterin reductase
MTAFGLNRLDYRDPPRFAADAARIERLGWDWAFIPDSQLNLPDPWVMLAAAAASTERIGLGVLVTNPIIRDVTATAASAATLESLAPGRTLLGYGAGDTAVRRAGKRPARVRTIEQAVADARVLLRSEPLEMGAREPARLRAARLQPQGPAPVWIAAGGPKTLRAAGRAADGVFIRVGRDHSNLESAVAEVRAGAEEAGRRADEVKLGLVVHTILMDDTDRAKRLAKAMAAGFYEYAPYLFDAPGVTWDGPPVEQLKSQVWPDFHHTADLDAAAALVDFLPDSAADAFALHGTADTIADGLNETLAGELAFEIVVPHPMPPPPQRTDGDPSLDYAARFMREVRHSIDV